MTDDDSANTSCMCTAVCPRCGAEDIADVAGLDRDGVVCKGSTATCPDCSARLVSDGMTDADYDAGSWRGCWTWRIAT